MPPTQYLTLPCPHPVPDPALPRPAPAGPSASPLACPALCPTPPSAYPPPLCSYPSPSYPHFSSAPTQPPCSPPHPPPRTISVSSLANAKRGRDLMWLAIATGASKTARLAARQGGEGGATSVCDHANLIKCFEHPACREGHAFSLT